MSMSWKKITLPANSATRGAVHLLENWFADRYAIAGAPDEVRILARTTEDRFEYYLNPAAVDWLGDAIDPFHPKSCGQPSCDATVYFLGNILGFKARELE